MRSRYCRITTAVKSTRVDVKGATAKEPISYTVQQLAQVICGIRKSWVWSSMAIPYRPGGIFLLYSKGDMYIRA